MRAPWTKKQVETVVVQVHGRLLDSISFDSPEQAEGYKRGVRRWAREKGVIVGIWSQRAQQIWPGTAQARAG